MSQEQAWKDAVRYLDECETIAFPPAMVEALEGLSETEIQSLASAYHQEIRRFIRPYEEFLF